MTSERSRGPRRARGARAAARAAAFCLALVAAACAYGAGEAPLRAIARTAHDAAPDAEAWRTAGGLAGRSASEGRFWLLPGWASGAVASVGDEGDTLTRVRFSLANLGLTVLPVLPLWFSSEARHDVEGGGTATAATLWTPLWASSRAEGWPADAPAPSAWGVPLLYGRVRFGAEDAAVASPRVEVHTTLWTLGPSWIGVDVEHEDEHVVGWTFLPVTLAGFGPLVWDSSEVTTERPEGTEHASAHGPLGGFLGYRATTRGADGSSSRRLLSGLLWYDEVRADGGEVSDAYHGPLWAMIGWGRTHGRPCVRLLWFPIPVG